MSYSAKSLLLDEIEILVKHFGLERVRAAVAKFSTGGEGRIDPTPRKIVPRGLGPIRPTVDNAIGSIRGSDPEKYFLLSDFLRLLRDRRVLPESQDIRVFAQLVGLKEIHGKSRRDMIPMLMRFLLQRPTDILRVEIQRAGSISQQQRREGFSVLTDKILGHK
jgi:hypothetical protein